MLKIGWCKRRWGEYGGFLVALEVWVHFSVVELALNHDLASWPLSSVPNIVVKDPPLLVASYDSVYTQGLGKEPRWRSEVQNYLTFDREKK
ncbi:hypothetical protein ACTXT7_013061 [Hymenolepis weldensis]